MIQIRTHRSGAGMIKQYHTIYDQEPSGKALSSLVLLNNYYHFQDEDYLNADWRTKVHYNIGFLKYQLSIHGKLCCVYCQKENLIINEDLTKNPPKQFLATADHVIPPGKGGEEFNYNNLVVACWRCNTNKKDRIGYKISEKLYIWK